MSFSIPKSHPGHQGRRVPKADEENLVRHEVFKLGLNPYLVAKRHGLSRGQMNRICCHAVGWGKWSREETEKEKGNQNIYD